MDTASGQIGIILYSATPIATLMGGSLVTIDFHQIRREPGGSTVINLAQSVHPVGHLAIWTAVDDVQGPFSLHPIPTNGFDPGIDGRVLLYSGEAVNPLSNRTGAREATRAPDVPGHDRLPVAVVVGPAPPPEPSAVPVPRADVSDVRKAGAVLPTVWQAAQTVPARPIVAEAVAFSTQVHSSASTANAEVIFIATAAAQSDRAGFGGFTPFGNSETQRLADQLFLNRDSGFAPANSSDRLSPDGSETEWSSQSLLDRLLWVDLNAQPSDGQEIDT